MSDLSIKLGLAMGLTTMGRWRGEQWETLFEGTVTTDEASYPGSGSNGQTGGITASETHLKDGTKYRLTVDGSSTVFTAETSGIVVCIGNAWLIYSDDSMGADSGFDFAVSVYGTPWHFHARTAGTYNVKIERLVS